MGLYDYLRMMASQEASDLFFSTGAPPNIKIQGLVSPVSEIVLAPGEVKKMAYGIISNQQQREFESEMELNFALSIEGLGRFRVNLYVQRGEVSMAVRYIKTNIPSIDELNLPPILKTLIMEPRGLVLIVGATGAGKSTTLASMIDYRNTRTTGHILTIEDPIEYYHSHKKSVVDQREVGIDTHTYGSALKNAMREAPDVILIGEIRDRETMQAAIAYAETGHLCLSTLHSNNASQTIDRIVNFFPEAAHKQLLLDLSLNLRAVVSQRLVKGLDGARHAAVEVMLKSAYISDLIEKADINALKQALEKADVEGTQTFDQALYKLYKQGKISLDETLRNADSKTNLSLKLRLEDNENGTSNLGLSLDKK
ncbi:MAG: PilT/PilU family type 4a pilus ATPase [Pseudomonadota bacterium]